MKILRFRPDVMTIQCRTSDYTAISGNKLYFWAVVEPSNAREERGGGGSRGKRTDRVNLVLASTRFSVSRCTTGANQTIFRAPVRFDFLANGRHNGG
jgi:hypothetical protein